MTIDRSGRPPVETEGAPEARDIAADVRASTARQRDKAAEARHTLAFVDVDGLKAVNDGQGHAAGDRLLRGDAEAMLSRLRNYDLVVRYGGDEFLCALPGADLEDAGQRLDAMTDDLTTSSSGASVSVGLAVLEDADTLEGLITRADAALYTEHRAAREHPGSPPAPAHRSALDR